PVDTDAGGPSLWFHRLFGRSLRHRKDGYEDAALGFGAELDATGGQRKQRVVTAQADVLAGMPLGAALARNNVARDHALTAEHLDAKPLRIGIAAVSRRAACFFVSHRRRP